MKFHRLFATNLTIGSNTYFDRLASFCRKIIYRGRDVWDRLHHRGGIEGRWPSYFLCSFLVCSFSCEVEGLLKSKEGPSCGRWFLLVDSLYEGLLTRVSLVLYPSFFCFVDLLVLCKPANSDSNSSLNPSKYSCSISSSHLRRCDGSITRQLFRKLNAAFDAALYF